MTNREQDGHVQSALAASGRPHDGQQLAGRGAAAHVLQHVALVPLRVSDGDRQVLPCEIGERVCGVRGGGRLVQDDHRVGG